MNHSFHELYSILNLNVESDGKDLKKSYRILIQKWHPDRYSNEVERELATNKIKDLNIAYKTLSEYYKQHGVLPLATSASKPNVELDSSVISQKPAESPTRAEPEQSNSTKSGTYNVQQPQSTINRRPVLLFSLIIVAFYVYSQFSPFNDDLLNTYREDSAQHISSKKYPQEYNSSNRNQTDEVKTKTTEILQNSSLTQSEKKEKFFTYGSSIGEVVLIQGPPERTEGNVWYYGKSEIHFNDGLVSYWIRAANNPLKAEITKNLKNK